MADFEPSRKKLPHVVWDAICGAFVLVVAVLGQIPIMLIAVGVYAAYRVLRYALTGVAYPEPKPGQHRSFSIPPRR